MKNESEKSLAPPKIAIYCRLLLKRMSKPVKGVQQGERSAFVGNLLSTFEPRVFVSPKKLGGQRKAAQTTSPGY